MGPRDVAETLEGICARIRAAFRFRRALLALYDPETGTAHAVVQQGLVWPGDEWLPLDRFPFLERALAERRAVYVSDKDVPTAMPHAVAERFDVRSLVAVPLLVEGRCLGFLVFDREGEAFRLEPEELELLTGIGLVAAVFIDKTDRYAELERAHDELRRLDEAKSEFISIASHELRTPIAIVHGITSTLHLRGAQLRDDQLVELRRALFEQTTRLQGLVEQLLDLSRLEAGALSVTRERFHPRELIDRVLPTIAPDRLRDIDVAVDPALEIESDPRAVERVVANLLANALRHGRPPVRVAGEHADGIRLVVEDRGDGIDPQFVPELFERFTRAPSTRAGGTDGAGLGLAIASSFAKQLGGSLRYEPAAPRGARFTLELPA